VSYNLYFAVVISVVGFIVLKLDFEGGLQNLKFEHNATSF